MSGATWKEYLSDVFEGIESPDNINLDQLLATLRARGISGLKDVDPGLSKLEVEGKKQDVVRLLWDLAHLEGKTAAEQREVYAKLARHYDKLFEWEDVESPGWFIIPGPFFP